MPGPPKQSNAHKKATGSKKLHHSEDLTPELLTALPECPVTLGSHGAEEWDRMCSLLLDEQLLTEWDLPAIKIMCMEWERYFNAVLDIERHGTYQRAQSGYEQTRPVVAERDKGFANYAKLLEKFGGDVVARSKMKRVRPTVKATNPYESI